MGKLIPVFAAFKQLCFGIQIFREPKEVGPGPLISCYIFLFAAFLLLWDIRLYPKSLRKLGLLSQSFVEYLIATFLLENIMIDFWFPLEIVVLGMFPKLADSIEEMLQTGEWSCDSICETLRNEYASFAASYFLSTFFLLAVLHATRAIDLRELEYGPECFFGDIVFRFKRQIKKYLKYIGVGNKKRVQIKEIKDKKGKKLMIEAPPKGDGNGSYNSTEPDYCVLDSDIDVMDDARKCGSDLKNTFSDFEMALNDD